MSQLSAPEGTPAILVAVIPVARAVKMSPSLWKAGRTNGFTQTMFRTFPNDAEAVRFGQRLTCVWGIEH